MSRYVWTHRGRRASVPTVILITCSILSSACDVHAPPDTRFEVTYAESARSEPITGRVLIMITRNDSREPRLQAGAWESSVPFFGVDVEEWQPGEAAVFHGTTVGYPPEHLGDIPAGSYYVQAIANVYTEFHRSDGHIVWLHNDQWEGQQLNRSPGNLVSEVQRVYLDPDAGYTVQLELTEVLPPVQVPPDTEWVRRIKFQSDLLTEFWGHPIYLGATVLLPKGYDENPDQHYPVLYAQGHFSLGPPFGFTTDDAPRPEDPDRQAVRLRHNRGTSWEFSQQWMSNDFPRMIGVTFQHPTPYYDDSYAVNSANNGPYGSAIITELIPRVEEEFRIIREGYARVLTGGSTGGWESLVLQVQNPEFFGGAWVLYPDPIDFTRYGLINIYEEANAYTPDLHHEWIEPERYWMRDHWNHGDFIGQPTITMRDMTRFEQVLGNKGRGAQQLGVWEAVYGPVGEDGYPRPLWDIETGAIDHEVAEYMRANGYDLVHYIRENWDAIGPDLVGKLRVYVGEMDQFYLNLAVYELEEFFETAEPRYGGEILYGRPMMSHGWQPMSRGEMLREMARVIAANRP